MVTFNNGQNVNTKNMSTFPFEAEVQRLKEQMVISLEPYDLLSQVPEGSNASRKNKEKVFEESQLRRVKQNQPQQMQPQQMQQA